MRSRFESACDAQGGFEAAGAARTLKLMDCEGEQGAPTRIQVQQLIVVARRKSWTQIALRTINPCLSQLSLRVSWPRVGVVVSESCQPLA